MNRYASYLISTASAPYLGPIHLDPRRRRHWASQTKSPDIRVALVALHATKAALRLRSDCALRSPNHSPPPGS